MTTRSGARGASPQLHLNHCLITARACSLLRWCGSKSCRVAVHKPLGMQERQTQAEAGRAEGPRASQRGMEARPAELTETSDPHESVSQAEGQCEQSPQEREGKPEPREGTDHMQTQPGPGQASLATRQPGLPVSLPSSPPPCPHPLTPPCVWGPPGGLWLLPPPQRVAEGGPGQPVSKRDRSPGASPR